MPADNSRLIVIDPGHGGSDIGAAHNGLMEKDLTLDISRRLRAILIARGWQVKMTRDTDVDVFAPNDSARDELQARSDVANNAGARLFVSVHINSSTSSAINGTTSYYYKPEDSRWRPRSSIGSCRVLPTDDLGVRKEAFYVMKHTSAPASLVETAFISNPVGRGADALARLSAEGRASDRRRDRLITRGSPQGSCRPARNDRHLRLGARRADGLPSRRERCFREADVLYLADQAHVPYGDRSPAELQALLAANLRFLEEAGVDAIAAGCNTSCAIARRFGWPRTRVPVFDIIARGRGIGGALGAAAFRRARDRGDGALGRLRRRDPRAASRSASSKRSRRRRWCRWWRAGARQAPEARRGGARRRGAVRRPAASGDLRLHALSAAGRRVCRGAGRGRSCVWIRRARRRTGWSPRSSRIASSRPAVPRSGTTGDAALFREQIARFAGDFDDVEQVGLRGLETVAPSAGSR